MPLPFWLKLSCCTQSVCRHLTKSRATVSEVGMSVSACSFGLALALSVFILPVSCWKPEAAAWQPEKPKNTAWGPWKKDVQHPEPKTSNETSLQVQSEQTPSVSQARVLSGNATAKPRFHIKAYHLGVYSIERWYSFHIMPWLSKLAFDGGFLKEAVPNWNDFSVSITGTPDVAVVCSAASAKAALPGMLRANIAPVAGSPPITAILGGTCDQAALMVGSAAGIFNVPVLAISSAGDVSKKAFYPFFARTSSPASKVGASYAALCAHFKWHNVAIIQVKSDARPSKKGVSAQPLGAAVFVGLRGPRAAPPSVFMRDPQMPPQIEHILNEWLQVAKPCRLRLTKG